MDAKPQRPLRTLRVKNDENVPPLGPNTKTIHQRNKSSPALSMISAGGIGLKAAAKRTAFGDVTNTVNIAKSSKDDSNLILKPSIGKIEHIDLEKKPAALTKPAQRPLSVSSLRNLLTGSYQNTILDPAHKSQSTDTNRVLQPSRLTKVNNKKSNSIFKDILLDPVQENEPAPAPCQQEIETHPPVVHDITQIPPHSRLCLPQPPTTSTTEPAKEPPLLTSDTSLPGLDAVTLEQISLPSEVKDKVELAGLNENLSITINDGSALPSHENRDTLIHSSDLLPLLLPNIKTTESQVMPNAPTFATVQTLPPIQSLNSYETAQVDQEEYWDEEDDEGFDEEGYVTARSYRSRGDNTTGGATAVLFPQFNQKARREISTAKQLVEATRTAEEIEDEFYDTSMVAEYGDEIFDYMKQQEVKMLPNAHYMDSQHEIQWSMRSVLMDWLVQVHHRFNLLPETLFLCVNYIDRFLSCKVVSLGKLQLVGATAIFIAAKYEEINCPSVQEIVYMVDGGYSVDEILKAERFMLTMLQFELGWPGPMSFLRRISKADDYDLETRTLAKYFLEVTVMDERFIGSPPSFAAAASHCLARLMLRKGIWTPHHVYYSGYTFSQLRPCVKLLLECCEDPRKHHAAVYNKYCDKRYKRASAFVETEVQRGFQVPESQVMKNIPQPPVQPYFDTLSYFHV